MTTTKKKRQTNKTKIWAWRGGWAIKSTCCPYRGPRFDSPTHTHGDSELAIVPVQGIFWLPQAPGTRHMWWTDTHTHKIKKKNECFKKKPRWTVPGHLANIPAVAQRNLREFPVYMA